MPHDFNWQEPDLSHNLDNNGMPIGLPVDDWTPAIKPSSEPMNGKYCKLEIFDLVKHPPELFNAFSRDKDAINWTYLPYGPFQSLDEFKQWCQKACITTDPLFHSVIDLETGRAIGLASYLRITPDIGSIEVGHIHYSPLMQGTCMATECMYLMMMRVFDELGYRRYEWKCNALNAPSCRAAERLGFQFEGIFRQATMSKGQNRDTAWFSIIDSEWPRMKVAFQRWLASDNFDSHGTQLSSLNDCRKTTA